MGGRGAFEKSGGKGIDPEYREYSTIGYLNHIKIVQWDKGTNNKTITYSNTKNTTYYSYNKEDGKIDKIYYYRNHRLVKSVDIYNSFGQYSPHTHYWGGKGPVGRTTHDTNNVFELNDKDLRLLELALNWSK